MSESVVTMCMCSCQGCQKGCVVGVVSTPPPFILERGVVTREIPLFWAYSVKNWIDLYFNHQGETPIETIYFPITFLFKKKNIKRLQIVGFALDAQKISFKLKISRQITDFAWNRSSMDAIMGGGVNWWAATSPILRRGLWLEPPLILS